MPSASARSRHPATSGPDGDLFTADITEVVITGLDATATKLVIESWTPECGLRRVERDWPVGGSVTGRAGVDARSRTTTSTGVPGPIVPPCSSDGAYSRCRCWRRRWPGHCWRPAHRRPAPPCPAAVGGLPVGHRPPGERDHRRLLGGRGHRDLSRRGPRRPTSRTAVAAGRRPPRLQRDRRDPGGRVEARRLRRGPRLPHGDAAGERGGTALDHQSPQCGPAVPDRPDRPCHEHTVCRPPPGLRGRVLEWRIHGLRARLQ